MIVLDAIDQCRDFAASKTAWHQSLLSVDDADMFLQPLAAMPREELPVGCGNQWFPRLIAERSDLIVKWIVLNIERDFGFAPCTHGRSPTPSKREPRLQRSSVRRREIPAPRMARANEIASLEFSQELPEFVKAALAPFPVPIGVWMARIPWCRIRTGGRVQETLFRISRPRPATDTEFCMELASGSLA